MYTSLKTTYKAKPEKYLADSAYRNKDDLEYLYKENCLLYMPTKKKKTKALRERVLRNDCKDDSEADQEWIKRMETMEANKIYNRRIRASETINAFLKNHGVQQFMIRGINKVKGLIDLACLAFNILTLKRLYNII